VGTDAFVAGNENVEHFGADETVKVLFDLLSIGFGDRHDFDGALAEPLDKLILPIFYQRARTHHNDALRRGPSLGRDAGFEQSVNQSN